MTSEFERQLREAREKRTRDAEARARFASEAERVRVHELETARSANEVLSREEYDTLVRPKESMVEGFLTAMGNQTWGKGNFGVSIESKIGRRSIQGSSLTDLHKAWREVRENSGPAGWDDCLAIWIVGKRVDYDRKAPTWSLDYFAISLIRLNDVDLIFRAPDSYLHRYGEELNRDASATDDSLRILLTNIFLKGSLKVLNVHHDEHLG